jgi:hypothetical protein
MKTGGYEGMDLPEGRSKDSDLLSRSFRLRRSLRLYGFLRLFRGELLLDLEGHSVGIDTVDLGVTAESLSAVCLSSCSE